MLGQLAQLTVLLGQLALSTVLLGQRTLSTVLFSLPCLAILLGQLAHAVNCAVGAACPAAQVVWYAIR